MIKVNVCDVLRQKSFYLSALLLFLPVYTWSKFLKKLIQRKTILKETELFQKRHNCCVLYFKDKGYAGWPPHKERIRLDFQNKNSIFEPLLYFLQTAEKSLDIAVMMTHIKIVMKTLCDMQKKGVKIRLVLDYVAARNEDFKKLQMEGASIRYFININSEIEKIMHHKYVVKDGEYLLFGSMNWTNGAFMDNYENLVFTSENSVVNSFHQNFEDMWKYVNEQMGDVEIQAILKRKLTV